MARLADYFVLVAFGPHPRGECRGPWRVGRGGRAEAAAPGSRSSGAPAAAARVRKAWVRGGRAAGSWIGPRRPPHAGQSRVGQSLGAAGLREARAAVLRLPVGGTGSPPRPTADGPASGDTMVRPLPRPLGRPRSLRPEAQARRGVPPARPRRRGGVPARARGSGGASPRGGGGAGAAGVQEEMRGGESRAEHSWQRARVRPQACEPSPGRGSACCLPPASGRACPGPARGREDPGPGMTSAAPGRQRPVPGPAQPFVRLAWLAGQPPRVSLPGPGTAGSGREAGAWP